MILPRKWIIWRPGFLIPVFFLSFCQVSGQFYQHDAKTLALGQCYVSRTGLASAALNQAGLGRMAESSASLHHLRPFITPELDRVSVSAQISMENGGPGFVLSSIGIAGLRQSSAWLSYGLKLHTRLSAGVGLHLCFTSIPEDFMFHSEAGFALGFQFMFSEELILGAHLEHPAAWTDTRPESTEDRMIICTGFSYEFFKTTRVYSEFHINTGEPVQWCMGLAAGVAKSLEMYFGINTRPWSLSTGFSINFRNWSFILSAVSLMDTGISPSTSLSHAW